MANQYSITVSNGADAVLKRCKDNGKKVSQCISAAIETLGFETLMNLVVKQQILEKYWAAEDDEE